MTFQPVLASTGLVGWQFLSRTADVQQASYARSPVITTAIERFREGVGSVQSAQDLVSNRAVLEVVLGAYGLQDDLPNKFFIRKVMEDGTSSPEALSNRLADPRYAALAEELNFSEGRPALLSSPEFLERLETDFKRQRFEVAVGQQDVPLRLSLGLERELGSLTERIKSADAQWFAVMGNPPLRRVFEAALGLPKEIGSLDIDQQLVVFRDRAEAKFGFSTPGEFNSPKAVEDLRRAFLVASESARPTSSPLLSLFNPQSSSVNILQSLYGNV